MESRRNNSVQNQIERVEIGELSPYAAVALNHLFFTHTGTDTEIDAIVRFLGAWDTYMDGLEPEDFERHPPPGELHTY